MQIKTSGQILSALREVLTGSGAFLASDGRPATNQLADYALPADACGVVVATSGSTGSPKAVWLTSAAMRAAAEAFQRRYGVLTWVNILPKYYVAGLMVLVRGWISYEAGASEPVALSSLRGLVDAELPDGAKAISIVPTQLQQALADEQLAARLAEFELILLGGAAIDAALLARGRAAGLRLITSYGMSETCGGAAFDGVLLDNIECRIDADQRIWLRGPALFSGYLGQPELSANTLVDGWLRTNDRGELVDGKIKLHGRFDDVVISGGVNVDLAQGNRLVHAVDSQAVLVGVPDEYWGTRIDLVATRAWQPAELVAAVLAETGTQLARASVPKHCWQIAQLPLTSTGKLDRQALITWIQAQKLSD